MLKRCLEQWSLARPAVTPPPSPPDPDMKVSLQAFNVNMTPMVEISALYSAKHIVLVTLL